MRKRLLSQPIHSTSLHKLLVLITMFITLPLSAMGDEVTYSFTSTSITDGAGTATSTTGNATQNWEFKNFSITNNRIGYVISSDSLKISNIIYYDSHDGPTTVEFDLMSDFTLTGAFVSAEITYCTNKMETKTVTIAKNEGTFNSLLTDDNVALGSTPTTILLDNTHANNRNFNGNKISFHFSFTTITATSGQPQDASFTIQSIKITTGPIEYDIKVENTQVTAGNASNILAGTSNDGKVSYDATQNILTLNEANLTMPIQTNIDNLIIELKGENKINTNAAENTIKRISSNETLNLTIRPASTDPLGSINLANLASSSTSLVDGFNLSLGGELFAYPSLNNSSTHNSYITSLLIGGQMVAKTGSVFSSHNKISFNNASNNNVLTLSGVSSELNSNKIISGLSNLTINYDGANTITMGDTATVITSTNSNSTLSFTKASNASSLTISNTGMRSVIHGFNSINYGDGIYTSTPAPATYINTPNNGLMSALDNTMPINSLSLSSNPSYQLWVAGIQATSTTSGTGWSYDAANNKLTLDGGTNGITIIGQIISGLGDLSIHIKGYVTLKASGSETNLIKSTNNGGLTFETDASIGNNLYFKNSSDGKFGDNSIYGFTTVAYEAGLGYYSQFSEITEVLYIEYNSNKYKLHSSNKSDIVGDGGTVKYSYDATNGHVITLTSADIEVIEWRIDNDLTVALNGANVITSDATTHTYSINYYGNLNIVKASGATSAELRTSTNGYTPINTTNLTLGSGLYLKPILNSSTTITDNPEFVLFNGYAMTNGQTINKTNPAGSLVYSESGSEKTLTFTNFQDAFGDGTTQVNAIETGVVGLKVIFVGNNKITCNDNGALAFKSIQTNASIQFVKGGDGCKLTMNTKTDNPLSFGDGKVTYDQLIYYSSNGNEKYICEPTPPTMGYNDQEKVTLGKVYTDGDIYYDITYAEAGKTNETGVKYTAPFALEAPATVEAWVVANGATTTKTKGKHFGYEGAPFTMLANETKTPVLIPAIDTGDDIICNSYSSSDDNIATFTAGANGGVITAVAFGNATLTTSMETTGTAILNDNIQIKTVVKVAKDITGISFSGNAQYSSYCNTDADDLTLPNGIKAYAVKIPTSGNEVVLSEIGFIPGTVNSQNPIYTPILLKRDDTSKTSFGTVTKYVRESGYTLPSNDLKFTTAGENTNDKECYILYKDAFVKATGTIAQDRCYLEKPSTNPNPARGFVIEGGDDGSTAIDDTLINEEETGNGEWYDLQGRRIQKPTKPGLYIVNGKKVVVTNK